MVVAIDGPAGTGKSTIAGIIAEREGIVFLNSGSFYRAITLAVLEAGIDVKDSQAVIDHAKTLKLDYSADSHLILNGVDVNSRLHEDKVSENASPVSAIPEIRKIVDTRIHEVTKSHSIVCEGRDMTTVVFPDAEFKFYLDASLDVQAQRRFDQGVSNLTLEEIKESIRKRDELDKNKAVGSLKIAPDATYIDTSHLTIEEVCAIIINKIHQK
ncbi:MAG: (d)CMP kinase [Treponema sp.]|nr:(d)CMP kinase [Treponema sp.]